MMKIFLDTADTKVIQKHYLTGLIDGVTTNPSLIMKSGRDPEKVYEELVSMGIKDISMEVVGDEQSMVAEGIRLANKFGDAATIKLPCTKGGLIVCDHLSQNLGVRTNVTLVFCAAQAVLAAKAGATYVSPIVGLDVVRSISELYRIHGVKTQVLAASIRNVQRAIRSWYNGAEICTMPPKVFEDMYKHVLTEKGIDIFNKDWESVTNGSTKSL